MVSVQSHQDLTANVNKAQQHASSPYHHIWTTAHAGSGKTRVLVNRVLRLLLAGEQVGDILCITYTRNGAVEMMERLRDTLGGWSMMSDEELSDTLSELGVHKNDSAAFVRAKALFLEVLNAPSGLQIHTFHGFCQSVLARFPLEAYVSPDFKLLSEVESNNFYYELADRIVQQDLNETVEQSIQHLSLHINEEQFFALIKEIYESSDDFEKIWHYQIQNAEKALEQYGIALWQTLNVRKQSNLYEEKLHALATHQAKELLSYLLQSSVDEKSKEIIRDWLTSASEEKIEKFPNLYAELFTGKRTLRQRISKHVPTDQQQKLFRLFQEVQFAIPARHAIGKDTESALYLARAVIDLYQQHKHSRGLLDYNDLIAKVRLLLDHKGQTSWVHFKLDGGIRHILVDEAQDSNAAQWAIFEGLVHEFYAGQGVPRDPNALERTLFVVGDPKQAIFSFQGNDPDAMTASRERLGRQARDAGTEIDDVALNVSFRSSPQVLGFVDAVYKDHLSKMGVKGDAQLRHQAFRKNTSGFVTLLPLAISIKDEQGQVIKTGTETLIDAIVSSLKSLLGKWRVPSTEDMLKPEDVLILFRKRSKLFYQMARALQRQQLKVSTSFHIQLAQRLPIVDLINLLEVLLDPQDDYRLSCVMKSPFVGFSEEEMFAILYDRNHLSVWQVLKNRTDQKSRLLYQWIENLRKYVDFEPPFEIIERILHTPTPYGRANNLTNLTGYQALEGRQGIEASEALELLTLKLLNYDAEGVRSLRYVLDDLAFGREEVTTHSNSGQSSVRLMTIHGAKGLEAPLVILPDTVTLRDNIASAGHRIWNEGERTWYAHSADIENSGLSHLTSQRDTKERKRAEEEMRLLYVGLTRARDGLLLCGAYDKKQPLEKSWYYALVEGMENSEQSPQKMAGSIFEGDLRAWTQDQFWQIGDIVREDGKTRDRQYREGDLKTKVEKGQDWFQKPYEGTDTYMLKIRQASQLVENESLTGRQHTGLFSRNRSKMERGILIHKLLECLPKFKKADWQSAAHRILSEEGAIFADIADGERLSQHDRTEIVETVLRIMCDDTLQHIFTKGFAEVPIAGVVELNGQSFCVQARVDRLLIEERKITLVDYKSGSRPKDGRIPKRYRQQMATYGELVRKLWRDKQVCGLLLWIDDATISTFLDDDMRL